MPSMNIPEFSTPLILFSTKENKTPDGIAFGSITQTTTTKTGHGYGLITGYKTNIMVLDIDYTKKINGDYSNNPFHIHFGEIEEYINKVDTYTVKTINGGYHLYFIYDSEITQTQNKRLNIDTRSDGGYIISPLTEGYNVYKNSSVKIIPSDLKQWLLKNLYSKKQERINKQRGVNNEMVKKTDVSKYEAPNNWKIRITYKQMKTILNRLPQDKDKSKDFISLSVS